MKSTLQLELVVPGTRTQGLTVAVDPDGWLVKLKSTVPVGGLLVPLAALLTRMVPSGGMLAGFVVGQASHVLVERVFFFNDTATTEIFSLSLQRRSSDLV